MRADIDRMGSFASPQAEEDFWYRHAIGGVVLSAATVAAAIVYVLLTWEAPHRPRLLGVLMGTAGLTAVIRLLPLRALVRHRLRSVLFAGWSTAVCVLLAVGMALDGGVDSPITIMLVLPLSYAAMAYPPWGIAAVGAEVILVYAGFAVAAGTFSGAGLITLATLLLVAYMCARTAGSHWRAFDAQAALSRRLATLADHDGLTGCLNHRAFHERLAAELERAARDGSSVSVVLLDLDGFKAVNDTYGHPDGDALLREVASALRAAIRPTDAVGRLGGDEFAVTLPGTAAAEAAALAERLREAVGAVAGPDAASRQVQVTASVGVAAVERGMTTAARLVGRADVAAYEAKRRGGDAVQVAPAPGGPRAEPSPADV